MMALRLSLCQPRLAFLWNRLPGAGLMCAVGLLLGVALAWARAPDPTPGNARQAAPAGTDGKSTGPQSGRRVREGTEIVNQSGHFRMSGDRVTFLTADGGGRFVVLENLNLERIARAIADSPERLQWGVTGTITEYRGGNFLFVRRAVLKNRVQSSEGSF